MFLILRYLSFILENYDNLPDYTLFIHGDPREHINLQSRLERQSEITGKEGECWWASINKVWLENRHIGWAAESHDLFFTDPILKESKNLLKTITFKITHFPP